MVNRIKLAGIAQASHYSGEFHGNIQTRAYNVHDKVEFSKEALEKLETFNPNEYRVQDEPYTSQDPGLQKSLNTLKLQQGATREQIKKAYVEAVKQYHPDNYSTLPPEFQKLAEEKTKEINSAYYNLKNS